MAFGSIVIPDNGTHSLEKAVAGKVYKGLELKIQSKGCYIALPKVVRIPFKMPVNREGMAKSRLDGIAIL